MIRSVDPIERGSVRFPIEPRVVRVSFVFFTGSFNKITCTRTRRAITVRIGPTVRKLNPPLPVDEHGNWYVRPEEGKEGDAPAELTAAERAIFIDDLDRA